MPLLKTISSLTVLFMYVVSIRCGYLLIRYAFHLKYLRFLILAVIVSAIETSLNIIVAQLFQKPDIFLEIISYSQKIYLSIEVIGIYVFYLHINKTLDPKNTVIEKFIFIPIITGSIYIGYYTEESLLAITFAEIIIVNYYFVKIVINELKNNQKNLKQYETYINNGLFIFINLITPYTVISEIVDQARIPIHLSLNFINDIGYIILFISLSKSAKCLQSN